MTDRRIAEAIDACRPDSDDVHEPDLAFLAQELARDPAARELYRRSQEIDAAIAAALADVPVPEGLAGRILTGLSAVDTHPARTEDSHSGVDSMPVAAPAGELSAPGSRRFSRRWVAAAIGTAIAAAIAVVVVNLPSGPEVNKDSVADLAREFFEADEAERPPGQLLEIEPAPARYPLSPSILLTNDVRWRRISGLLGTSGVAYDITALAAGGQARATLYVVPIPSSLTGLGATPPRSPLSTTAGVAIGAWQSQGLLYILAVRGDAKHYRLFIRAESIA
jgi:hypothetical protein